MIKKILNVLVLSWLMLIVGMTLASFVHAEGIEHIGTVPMDCNDPTKRVDGTDITEPVSVKFFLSDSVIDLPPPDDYTPIHTEIMANGCEPRTYNGNGLVKGVQYYKLAVAYERGEVSDYSEFLPFTFKQSPPLPPVITE